MVKKKILIIGGTGFIGFHLSKKCKKLKWDVVSISKTQPSKTIKINGVKYFTFDISNKKNFIIR